MIRGEIMHYATKLKKEIDELLKDNSKQYEAIWWAKTAVLGEEPGIRPFNTLRGNEIGMPLMDMDELRKIILDLPL